MTSRDRQTSEQELTFTMRIVVGVAVALVAVGIIYTTGIGKGHQLAGLAALAFGVASFYSAWRLAVLRRRIRRTKAGAEGQ